MRIRSTSKCAAAMGAAGLVMLLGAAQQGRAQLVGKYSDGQLTADFAKSTDTTSTGTLTMGGQQFPATAKTDGAGFTGTFTAGGNGFTFTAHLEGDTLALSTGGANYSLKKIGAVNPLAAANPLAGGPPAADTGGGFVVESSTDAGKSLLLNAPGAANVHAALKAAFPALEKFLGNRPQIGSAYEDAHDHQTGGATFTASSDGKPVKGIASCKMNGNGATVVVVYARADASKADWEKLTQPAAPTPAPAGSGDAGKPFTPPDPATVLGPDAQVHQFSDGTGSILVAPGWTIQGDSAIDALFLKGPDRQSAVMNLMLVVQSPDSQLVQMMDRNEAMARRWGGNPPPRPPMVIAKFSDPATALQDIFAQFAETNKKQGQIYSHIDKIISQKEVPTALKGGKAAILQWDATRFDNGKQDKMLGEGMIQIAPTGNGAWMFCMTGLGVPQETAKQEKPSIYAMFHSLKINDQVASQRMQQRNDQSMAMIKQQGDENMARLRQSHEQYMQDSQDRFEAGQRQHDEQMAGYQRHNDQWKADELQKSRNNADFVETIKGTRTIYDTRTGATGTADLNYAGAVVDQMNQATLDPNRFVQIPLRDELYPVQK